MKKKNKNASASTDEHKPQARALLKYWLPVIVWAVIIFTASSMPLPPRPPVFPHFDKVCHFIEYAVLGFLLLRALDSTDVNPKGFNLRMMAVLLAIIYGISDELHQYFVPGRFVELGDILSDGFGAYIGQLFFRIKRNI